MSSMRPKLAIRARVARVAVHARHLLELSVLGLWEGGGDGLVVVECLAPGD
jgi:hypothetical protein